MFFCIYRCFVLQKDVSARIKLSSSTNVQTYHVKRSRPGSTLARNIRHLPPRVLSMSKKFNRCSDKWSPSKRLDSTCAGPDGLPKDRSAVIIALFGTLDLIVTRQWSSIVFYYVFIDCTTSYKIIANTIINRRK